MLMNDNGKKSKELAEIYQVAHMYYDLNVLQADIAEQLFLSRAKVSRLLTQARELGIVEIKVNPIIDRLPSMEEKMRELFGLKDAIVISSHPDKLEMMEAMLAKFTAHYTSDLLKKGGTLGLVNSDTINAILKDIQFSDSAHTDIVQLVGATSNSLSLQETALLMNQINKTHEQVSTYPLSAPIYVNDLYLKEVLMQDPGVRQVMQKMTQCTVALTGISTMERDTNHHISWHGMMGPHHIDELRERRAVGCICAQYYDIHGVKVSSEWNAKTIALNINDIQKIETRIGVALGMDKLKAIWGAMQGRHINVLITDSNTASDLIKLAQKRQK